ncbi:MAG: FAD-dependent oxidoreductase [Planctomycetes bacterium]|nr:FAD-dependent oxidoreductase [Planctomycetota bacterium]
MPLRVGPLTLAFGADRSQLIERALRKARLTTDEVQSVELVRQSVDRRRGREPRLVYIFDLHLKDDARPRAGRPGRKPDPKLRWVDVADPGEPIPGDEPLATRPVVLGAGPGGLFAALVLARAGYAPRIIERGARMNVRVRQVEAFHRKKLLHPESNYLFGEGGAGTFSDGKLTSRSKDPRVRLVLDEFRRKSGLELVSYYYRPHLGSDRVRAVVGKLRREIEALGGTFHYECRIEALDLRYGRLVGLQTSDGPLATNTLIAAPGHSARDFYQSLLEAGIPLERKPFQMGFRIEHPQELVDRWVLGEFAADPELTPADYQLVAQVGGRGVFSFCMCPGGEIMPAVHDAAHYNTNGMSWHKKDSGFANSGFVTTIAPDEFEGEGVLAGLALQARYERRAAVLAGETYELPAQRLEDYLAGRPSVDLPPTSCRSGARPAPVRELVPRAVATLVDEALAVFEHRFPGFCGPEALICGPEARSSSPVRILRDPEVLMSLGADGLYPVGEGAGYAGGIVSAAVDGWRAAESLIRRFAPANK